MVIFLAIIFVTVLVLCIFLTNSLFKQIDLTNRLETVAVAQEMPHPLVTKLARIRFFKTVNLLLARAGFRSKTALLRFISAGLILSVFFAFIGLYIGLSKSFSLWLTIIVVLAGIIFGVNLLFVYVQQKIRNRQNKIRKTLPDSMQVISLYVDAGYPLIDAMQHVAKDLKYYAPEIAQECAITAAELDLVNDHHVAWQALINRTDLDEMRNLVTSLEQSDIHGISLKNILRNLTSQLNREQLVKAEEKAARIPAYMVIILVFCFLPVMFAVILTPLALRSIDAITSFF